MRAYKFLDAQYGLKSLYERRLKQSRICDLNDPFELTPYDLTNPDLRNTFLKTRDDMNQTGACCVSARIGGTQSFGLTTVTSIEGCASALRFRISRETHRTTKLTMSST